MNTKLTIQKLLFPISALNGESTLPPLENVRRSGKSKTALADCHGLYTGYGNPPSAFPYRMQDRYTRELKISEIKTVVLENAYLKATFLPEYGGKLHSLFDKTRGRELLYRNDVLRASNLAIRNAWMAGGVEWNCGSFGHTPLTCAPLFAVQLKLGELCQNAQSGFLQSENSAQSYSQNDEFIKGIDPETPVLRMYEFERIRRVTYQMDFFLPENSRLLYARMRIMNENYEVVPMYWWSNIAVPELDGARIVTNADSAFVSDDGISCVKIPFHHEIDVTYPRNNPHSIDYFWNIPQNERKYIVQLDESGYGLVQTSTNRLQGRKLFVWGQGPGGDRWQRFLTADAKEIGEAWEKFFAESETPASSQSVVQNPTLIAFKARLRAAGKDMSRYRQDLPIPSSSICRCRRERRGSGWRLTVRCRPSRMLCMANGRMRKLRLASGSPS